jgi:hypothetical protein
MMPAYRPGQIVIGRLRGGHYKAGDVVILEHAGLEKIKRIASIGDGRVYVLGDQPAESTDSRQFGWLDEQCIRAKIIWPRARVLR